VAADIDPLKEAVADTDPKTVTLAGQEDQEGDSSPEEEFARFV
tara:strand:+ start:452 stop:580 length:129 start_codon:yes stop_codon:yes gene_type:complete